MFLRYPYNRTVKFNQGIKSLGTDGDGRSCLDHFRHLITTIGIQVFSSNHNVGKNVKAAISVAKCFLYLISCSTEVTFSGGSKGG